MSHGLGKVFLEVGGLRQNPAREAARTGRPHRPRILRPQRPLVATSSPRPHMAWVEEVPCPLWA